MDALTGVPSSCSAYQAYLAVSRRGRLQGYNQRWTLSILPGVGPAAVYSYLAHVSLKSE